MTTSLRRSERHLLLLLILPPAQREVGIAKHTVRHTWR
jgi:hypothetical protein